MEESLYKIYDDKKGKFNSFESTFDTKSTIDGIDLNITGYGSDVNEAFDDMMNKIDDSFNKLMDVKPLNIRGVYITPNTAFKCVINPLFISGPIEIDDAKLVYDDKYLCYLIKSE